MEGTGVVGRIYENQSKKGDRYWNVVIDGTRYSVFKEDVRSQLTEGHLVAFTWEPRGRFRTITLAQVLGKVVQSGNGAPAPAASPGEAHVTPVERESRIIRQSCVKAAAAIVGPMCVPVETAGAETLGLAKRFEAWVLGKEAG